MLNSEEHPPMVFEKNTFDLSLLMMVSVSASPGVPKNSSPRSCSTCVRGWVGGCVRVCPRAGFSHTATDSLSFSRRRRISAILRLIFRHFRGALSAKHVLNFAADCG